MNTLAQLKPGQSAIISGFAENAISLKLMEMGCLPGEMVKVISYAPLGDPISIKVAGYILSIRKSEAALININAKLYAASAFSPSA